MEIWSALIQGFATAATPVNLMWAFVGCALDRKSTRLNSSHRL